MPPPSSEIPAATATAFPDEDASTDPEFSTTPADEPAPVQLDYAPDFIPEIQSPPEAARPGSWLARAGRLIGLDRAIVFTVLARGWASLAGICTLTLIARFLSPAAQGFYYTFYSLVAIQIVFELGFSVVILQAASHEAAHLVIAPDGSITGPEREHSRLASVLQKSVRWYTIAAVLMALTLIPVGIAFLRHVANKFPGTEIHFVAPWLLVVLASSCTFQIDPLFSFLEGCGYVPQVARTRLRQSMVSTALGWSAFLLHSGLFAPGLFILGQALAGGWFVFSQRHLLLPLLRRATEGVRVNWKTEIWPFQWRIAVSWLAGYFTSQLFVPALMNYRGAVEAGQMGMTVNVCGTLTTLAVAWLNTKAAPFGRMIARREFATLDRVFFRTLFQSTMAATITCGGVLLAVEWLSARGLRLHGIPLAHRLLAPAPLAMMLFGTVANVIVFGEALYLRAHKQEKFMVNSLLGAVYIAPLTVLLGRMPGPHGGAWAIALAYAAGTVVIGLGYGTYTFLKWRRIWHVA